MRSCLPKHASLQPRFKSNLRINQWIRVRDYRLQQIEKMDCVEIFRESKLTAQEATDVGADHIAVATGYLAPGWIRRPCIGKSPFLHHGTHLYA